MNLRNMFSYRCTEIMDRNYEMHDIQFQNCHRRRKRKCKHYKLPTKALFIAVSRISEVGLAFPGFLSFQLQLLKAASWSGVLQ
jgi:hypothetical protein